MTRPQSTTVLLHLTRNGDNDARKELTRRLLPRLRRWGAHGRLPQSARNLADTDDLVQVSLMRALEHVREFEPQHEGAFLSYLRRIVLNAVRDELRRAGRRPARAELGDTLPQAGRQPPPTTSTASDCSSADCSPAASVSW
jgi:RNA polymerase sigma-70 factor (ECF subfamily)